jgi:hypothetical protein
MFWPDKKMSSFFGDLCLMYSINNLQSENEIYKHETIIKEIQAYLKQRTN